VWARRGQTTRGDGKVARRRASAPHENGVWRLRANLTCGSKASTRGGVSCGSERSDMLMAGCRTALRLTCGGCRIVRAHGPRWRGLDQKRGRGERNVFPFFL
jgi:hypothetical protein